MTKSKKGLMESRAVANFISHLSTYFKSSGSSRSLYIENLRDQQQQQSYPDLASNYYSVLNSSFQNNRFASATTRKPLAILTPSTYPQVRAAILCCKQHGVEIRVRSGGHDYEGLSYSSYDQQLYFVVLDMAIFRSTEVDLETKTAWVGGGATLGEVYHSIFMKSRSLGFPAGMCPTVGVGGHFSGGGYGMISRKYGIAADHIVDAKMMDVNGNVLDRESMGEELFWAIRGGGAASFGIILAWKINLVPVPETVTVFKVTRTSSDSDMVMVSNLVRRWELLAHKLDEDLSLRVYLRSEDNNTRSSNKKSRSRSRSIQACFFSLFLGTSDQLVPMMEKEFPELGLVPSDCKEMSWIESTIYVAGLEKSSASSNRDILLDRHTVPPGFVKGETKEYFKAKSDFVKEPISAKGFQVMFDMLHEEDPGRAEILLSPYGGKFNDVPDNATPFPYRCGFLYNIHYLVFWANPGEAEEQRHMRWIRSLYEKMGPFVTQHPRCAYLNYRDMDLGGRGGGQETTKDCNERSTANYYSDPSVWGVQYFNTNFYKLVRIKAMADPYNFFRNEQSIPPTLPPNRMAYYLANH